MALILGALCKIFPERTYPTVHEVLEYFLMSLGGSGGLAAIPTIRDAFRAQPPVEASNDHRSRDESQPGERGQRAA